MTKDLKIYDLSEVPLYNLESPRADIDLEDSTT